MNQPAFTLPISPDQQAAIDLAAETLETAGVHFALIAIAPKSGHGRLASNGLTPDEIGKAFDCAKLRLGIVPS